jgi:ABC-2 type transport system ATP-binding protein
VASLLHQPDMLFLDEPTIGLDVTAKAVIRDLIREQSLEEGRTLLFTSHDTGDMERVCDRVIVIHRGRLLLDRSVAQLRREFIGRKRITVRSAEPEIEISLPGVIVTGRSPHVTQLELDVRRTGVERVVQEVLRLTRIDDLCIEDPPMEEIVQAIYAKAESDGGDGGDGGTGAAESTGPTTAEATP